MLIENVTGQHYVSPINVFAVVNYLSLNVISSKRDRFNYFVQGKTKKKSTR